MYLCTVHVVHVQYMELVDPVFKGSRLAVKVCLHCSGYSFEGEKCISLAA